MFPPLLEVFSPLFPKFFPRKSFSPSFLSEIFPGNLSWKFFLEILLGNFSWKSFLFPLSQIFTRNSRSPLFPNLSWKSFSFPLPQTFPWKSFFPPHSPQVFSWNPSHPLSHIPPCKSFSQTSPGIPSHVPVSRFFFFPAGAYVALTLLGSPPGISGSQQDPEPPGCPQGPPPAPPPPQRITEPRPLQVSPEFQRESRESRNYIRESQNSIKGS